MIERPPRRFISGTMLLIPGDVPVTLISKTLSPLARGKLMQPDRLLVRVAGGSAPGVVHDDVSAAEALHADVDSRAPPVLRSDVSGDRDCVVPSAVSCCACFFSASASMSAMITLTPSSLG